MQFCHALEEYADEDGLLSVCADRLFQKRTNKYMPIEKKKYIYYKLIYYLKRYII